MSEANHNHGISVPEPLPEVSTGRVVITGASTGIGWDTVARLRRRGWGVVAVARREERLRELAEETGCDYFAADLRSAAEVEALHDYVMSTGGATALVNNAGGALGNESVAEADPEQWLEMYRRNVMTSLLITQAFLPNFREDGGDVVFITSTAAMESYVGGGGYTTAKHGQRTIPETLRLELVGEPVRIIEIRPGIVKTPEFSLTRLQNYDEAEARYADIDEPLRGDDVAAAIEWVLTRPPYVNIDTLVMRSIEQANSVILNRLVNRGKAR